MFERIVKAAWSHPWLLLFLTTLFWASNVVTARLAAGEISPMALAGARWLVATAIMAPFVWRDLVAARAELSRSWMYVSAMGFIGFTVYSALFYSAGAHTSGVNLAILLSMSPVFTILGAWIFVGSRFAPIGVVGVVSTFLGALVLASHGDASRLATMTFNRGDLLIVAACLIHAAYTILLRKRPAIPSLAFFTALSAVAFVTSTPFIAAEAFAGQARLTAAGVGLLVVAAIFPTLLSQVFYIRAVELVGPHRAGLFYNLTPLLGALMSVALLGESFAPHHAVALALILGGILLAEIWGRR